MNYKCINKKDKFKNLTVNKDYDGIEDGDNIVITADNGTRQKYNKKYFQTHPRTLEHILDDGLDISLNRPEMLLRLTWRNEIVSLNITQSRVSCGLHELTGISQLEDFIVTIEDDLQPMDINFEELSEILWDKIIDFIKTELTIVVYLICSTDIDASNEQYFDILDQHSIEFAEGFNNNSGNNIKIWIIRIHE